MAISFTPGQIVPGPDWDALLAQHGGPKSTVLRPMTQAESDAFEDAGGDPVQNPVYRYFATDESYVEARRAPNGDYEIIDYHPSEKFKQAQAREAKQAPESNTPAQQRTAREEAEIAANANLPPHLDPRPETNAERADRGERVIKEQGTAARQAQKDEEDRRRQNQPAVVPTNTTEPYIVTTTNGVLSSTPNPNYRGEKPKEPTVTTHNGDLVQIDPSTNRVTVLRPGEKKPENKYADVSQDKDTGKWYGLTREGAWEAIRGGPGAETTPSGVKPIDFPEITLGLSQQAIRGYANQLNEEVAGGRMTSVQRNLRMQEAFSAANIALNEANILQHEDSSRINAQVNVATTRYTESMRGMEWAATLVSKLNGALPVGSNLGGRAFAALMGMQARLLAQSGLANIVIPPARGQPGYQPHATPSRPDAQQPRLTNPNNPQAVQADLDAVLASPELQPQQPATATPDAAVAPAAPATSPVTQSVATERQDDKVTIDNGQGRPMEVPRYMVGDGPGKYSPSQGWQIVADPKAAQPVTAPVTPTPTPSPAVPSVPPVAPSSIGAPEPPTSMMPPQQEYPVLAQYAAPQLPMTQPEPITMPDQTMPPAVLQSMAASKPPWSMSNEEIQQYLAAGVPREVVFGVPGRTGVLA